MSQSTYMKQANQESTHLHYVKVLAKGVGYKQDRQTGWGFYHCLGFLHMELVLILQSIQIRRCYMENDLAFAISVPFC